MTSYGPGPSYVSRRLGLPAAQRAAARQAAYGDGFAAIMNVPRPIPMRATSGYARPRAQSFAMRSVQSLNSRQNAPEVKFADYPEVADPGDLSTSTPVPLNTTGYIHCINAVAQGAGPNCRIGMRIEMISCNLRYFVRPKATTTKSGNFRVALVYDRQPNGAVPAYTDIFQTYTAGTATYATAASGVNLQNKNRFKVLYDCIHQFYPVTDTAGVLTNNAWSSTNDSTNVQRFVRIPQLITEFDYVGTADIGSVRTGSLLLVCYSDEIAAASEVLELFYQARTKYTDK